LPVSNNRSNLEPDEAGTRTGDEELPAQGFSIDTTRSNANRPVREYREEYLGLIIDTHVHLDPPGSGSINDTALEEIVEAIARAGVDIVIVMPVPNEGVMPYSSIGAEHRKRLRQIGEDKVNIKIFFGSEYISNWLHDAYRNGYSEDKLNDVLSRLSKDMDDPEYSGMGEIGLYHFNKTGRQNVIEYPPTFAPFLRIIGLAAKNGSWVDLHAEPVSPDGKSYEDEVFDGLKLLFREFPDLKLILSHTAMTNPINVRRILETYPRVMMNFKPITRHEFWRNLEPITNHEGRLYSDWAQLFEEMPERFMVGTDEKFGRVGKGALAPKGANAAKYEESIKRMRQILGSINPDAAQLIAYGNAKRDFK